MRTLSTVTLLLLIGCSSVTTYSQPSTTAALSPAYTVWLDGSFAWDDAAGTLQFLPSRIPEGHYDVWPMLNPPNCDDCVAVNVTSQDPIAKTLTADVTLRNPTQLAGWFVRGLVIPAPGSALQLLTPDGWWHPADFADDAFPAAFMIFAKDHPDLRFGPAEAHTATYTFRYGKLGDFNKCSYRVIVRFPKNPGEVTSIANPQIHGAFTTSGGFISFRADITKDASAPDVSPTARKSINDLGLWVDMRHESGQTYLTWFQGEPTIADTAQIWVAAKMVGNENRLEYRFDNIIQNVTPTPSRIFPPVTEGCKVFVDQLAYGMTSEQKQFMATHCVGSQKLVKTLADSMRAYNPGFIVIQYHLAFGEGDISNIHGNDWISNWAFVNPQEDFFEHRTWSTQTNHRVLQNDWNWYLADPTSDWVMYFIGNTIERMSPLGDQFDGVFADSASQPWNTDPAKWWEGSDDAHDMFTYWTPKTQYFFDTVVQAYHTLPTSYYLIPNAGSYVTTISDITYNQCDGIMIEGFAHWGPLSYFDEVDWRLQMNRARALAIQDKIILCQASVDVDETHDRSFVHGTYMLLQDNYTYLNMCGPWGLDPQWWPEYSWDPGPAIEDWANIDELQDSGGCYVRLFENGIAIVNPSDEARYYTTTKSYSHTMFASGGLLPDDGVPTGIATGPIIDPGVQEIPSHSAWLGLG